MERFSGGFSNSSLVMFCGGPVTAMVWCPTDKEEQVLAMVTKLDFRTSSLGEEGGGKGLVQFWRMGGLEMEGGGKPPVFLLLAWEGREGKTANFTEGCVHHSWWWWRTTRQPAPARGK